MDPVAYTHGVRRMRFVLIRHEGNLHEDHPSEEKESPKGRIASGIRPFRNGRAEDAFYNYSIASFVHAFRRADRQSAEHIQRIQFCSTLWL